VDGKVGEGILSSRLYLGDEPLGGERYSYGPRSWQLYDVFYTTRLPGSRGRDRLKRSKNGDHCGQRRIIFLELSEGESYNTVHNMQYRNLIVLVLDRS